MTRNAFAAAAAALVIWPAGAVTVHAEESVERICEAIGQGYFYIPGTETCLRLHTTVKYEYSRIKNTHSVGGGTTVYGAGGPENERHTGTYGDWIDRDGFGIGFRFSGDYGDLKIAGQSVVGVYGSYEGAWGDGGYTGNSMVGYDNVTSVGYTFLEPDAMYGTGVVTSTNGYGLASTGQLDNNWNRVNLGLKIAPGFLDKGGTGGERTYPRVVGRLGVFYEDLGTSASGQSDLTFNGAPVGGYYQNYDLNAEDRYFGIRTGAHVGFHPCLDGKLKTSIAADLYLGYHSGKGSFSQVTGVGGGNTVVQQQYHSDSGLTLGAGVSATASYEFAKDWRIGAKVEWSYLPKVTSALAPANPSQQGQAGYSSESAERWFGALRLQRTF